MGKIEGEQSVSAPAVAEISEENAGNRCRIGKFAGFRCVAALVFGVAVLLSAIFWLPPFLKGDRGDLDLDGQFGAPIAASFRLQKPISLLKSNISRLEYDIFEEFGVLPSVVLVASLNPVAGSNWTNVVFVVWPYDKNSTMYSAWLSLLRDSFVSLVIQQSTLHLTPSLFGDPSFFQVLKFTGGITVIPPQSGFLLQKVQILFNFTLNSSIYHIQEIFNELKIQLESGLHLTSQENLYIRLTNSYGSTLAPPVIVQSSVLLAVGNRPPSLPRLKQLAQAITSSHARNLGLNHTVFGKVKQVQLSSVLQHSLNSSNGSNAFLPPSPAPLPRPNHQNRHHNHHHHRHYRPDVNLIPAPAPQHSDRTSYRSNCPYQNLPKSTRAVPTVAPVVSPHPSAAPHLHGDPPVPSLPSPLRRHTPHPSSPLPAVFFARVQPPSNSAAHTEPPDKNLAQSPPASSSFGGLLSTVKWIAPKKAAKLRKFEEKQLPPANEETPNY
ncbi:hypothetical protein MRB53_008068 [Persea americana]|uniref:Uncharacterized protein n=1 Tax=Persea americana TaxID=3435 RepID=A0ACC2ML00_PERAE|nr:hypothetical protein MRB53_008068 [Persea americana]